MTRLSDIPVRMDGAARQHSNLSIAREVLNDIATALVHLASTGKPAAIDLRALPRMEPATYQYLKDALAGGEVTAVVDAQVRVEICETKYPGVWWLTHRNAHGAISTEIIEIAEVPQILRPHVADVRAGLKRLEQWLAAPASSAGSPATTKQTAVA